MKVRNWMLGAVGLCVLAMALAFGGQAGGSNPVTGEDTVLWPVIVLLALSAAGLIVMLIMKLKKRK